MDQEKKKALQEVILDAIGAKAKEVETIEIRILYKPSQTADEPKQS